MLALFVIIVIIYMSIETQAIDYNYILKEYIMSSNFIVRDFNFKEHAKIGYSDGETVLTFRTGWPRKQTGAQTVKLSEADDALALLKFLCELGLPKINKSAREDSAVRCLMKTIGVLEDGTVFLSLIHI